MGKGRFIEFGIMGVESHDTMECRMKLLILAEKELRAIYEVRINPHTSS